MSRLGTALFLTLGLALTGCWENEAPEPLPPREDPQVQEEPVALTVDGLNEIADIVREGDVYCGIVANLDIAPKTQEALKFKSILEKAARDELKFQKSLAEVRTVDILSPRRLSTFEGRQKSIDSIGELGKVYNDHAFNGGQRTLDAVQFLLQSGTQIDFEPIKVVQSDLDAFSVYLDDLVQVYGEVIKVCNEGGAKLDGGVLVFQDDSAVAKYEDSVKRAKEAESNFYSAYNEMAAARQRMIDAVINAAGQTFTKTESKESQ